MSKGKKRFWSDDEKREICVQTRSSDVSVARVARRYAVNANLIHKWLRDPRFSAADDDNHEAIEAAFLPIELTEVSPSVDRPLGLRTTQSTSALCATRIDLTLSDGRRILIEGSTAFGAVLGLVEGLML